MSHARADRDPDGADRRAVHPAPRDPAPGEGPGGDLRGRHGRAVLLDRHHGGAARRWRSGPRPSSRGRRSTASTTRTRWSTRRRVKFETLEYLEVLKRGLTVMDATAISLCMENRLPILVFDLRQEGNIKRVLLGEPIGTLVHGGRADRRPGTAGDHGWRSAGDWVGWETRRPRGPHRASRHGQEGDDGMTVQDALHEAEQKMKARSRLDPGRVRHDPHRAGEPQAPGAHHRRLLRHAHPIKELASFSVPEPRLLVVQPFDRTAMAAMEKAIMASDLGLTPTNDGNVIRLSFPPLTRSGAETSPRWLTNGRRRDGSPSATSSPREGLPRADGARRRDLGGRPPPIGDGNCSG